MGRRVIIMEGRTLSSSFRQSLTCCIYSDWLLEAVVRFWNNPKGNASNFMPDNGNCHSSDVAYFLTHSRRSYYFVIFFKKVYDFLAFLSFKLMLPIKRYTTNAFHLLLKKSVSLIVYICTSSKLMEAMIKQKCESPWTGKSMYWAAVLKV